MPKVLTEAQVETYERDGGLSPVRAMSAERARRTGARARNRRDEVTATDAHARRTEGRERACQAL